METAEYHQFIQENNSKQDKYLNYFIKEFNLKNSLTPQKLMKILQKYDKEMDIKKPLKVLNSSK